MLKALFRALVDACEGTDRYKPKEKISCVIRAS